MSVSAPIYLDNHATTPFDPQVVEAMAPYWGEIFGNAASRGHFYGQQARSAVEEARKAVARLINATPREIIWTSGATESNNLALLGVARASAGTGHLLTVCTEHKAVLDPAGFLEKSGYEVTYLPVDSDGLITVSQVESALRPNTALVSVMTANNEIGVLQPVAEIGALCHARGVLFHTDAAQALGKIPVDVRQMQADLMSLTAHKMHGPKGIGALFVRAGRPLVRLEPLIHGGGHERGLRSGTLAVPQIVGMGKAALLAQEHLKNGGGQRLAQMRDLLLNELQGRLSGIEVNGSLKYRLPNNLNLSIEGVEAEALMMAIRPVAVSSGSACSSETLQPSHVLRALGIVDERAQGSIRIGIGRLNTIDEIEAVAGLIIEKATELRAMNPLYEPMVPGTDLPRVE